MKKSMGDSFCIKDYVSYEKWEEMFYQDLIDKYSVTPAVAREMLRDPELQKVMMESYSRL